MKLKRIRTVGLSWSEIKCCEILETRGNSKVIRNGWPDFLLQRHDTGKLFGVEVKSGGAAIRVNQQICFEALERGGIQIFIWHPRKPELFQPWRNFVREKINPEERAEEFEIRRKTMAERIDEIIATAPKKP